MADQHRIASSRSAAISCLAHWSGTGKPVQGFVEKYIHATPMKQEDRQLAVMLVHGVLRKQQSLDAILSRFSRTPLRKMKPLTLAALRIGVFQLCCLDRIPESAAVNETVKALKKARQPGWLLKFVNGTLRAIAREKPSLTQQGQTGDGGEAALDHPQWLTSRWQHRFGFSDMVDICRVNNLEPQLCLQNNPQKITSEKLAEKFSLSGIAVRPGTFCPDSLILPGYRGAIPRLPGFSEGLFQVQDQAARLSCYLMQPFVEDRQYVDACAGLGGKTCTLAALLPEGATIHAVEPDKRRCKLLGENLHRQGLESRVRVAPVDLQGFAAASPAKFQAVFVDAPCSGTGVIRKHPDIRWNRSQDDLSTNQQLQNKLLVLAGKLVVPGGVVVYATCSLEQEENEQVVEQFLATHSEFSLSNCQDLLPASATSLVDENGMFNSIPSEEIEGFFAARMVRKL